MPQYTSQANIPSEVLALAPDPIQHQGSGLDEAGEMLLGLSAKLQAAKEATQESKAIAQYNEGMAEVEQAIAGTDPRDRDVDWVNITREKLRAARARALEGTSKRVRKSLSDKFIIDDQINVAKIAKRSIDEVGRLTRIEMPDQIQYYAAQRDRDGFIEYLRGKEDDEQSTGVSGVLTEPEVEHAIATYDKVAAKIQQDAALNLFEQSATAIYADAGGGSEGVKAASEWAVENMSELSRAGISLEDQKSAVSDISSIVKMRSDIEDQQKEEAQYQAYSGMLVNIWDGNFPDVKAISAALDKGELTATQAKGLRQAATAPPDTSLEAFAEIDAVMTDFAIGVKTKQQALDAILAKSKSISRTDGKAWINKLSAEKNKADEADYKFAKDSMEGIIRGSDDVDFDYQYITDARKNVGFSEGVLRLAEARANYAKENGKPMDARQYIVESTKIALEIKQRILEESDADTPVTTSRLEGDGVVKMTGPDGRVFNVPQEKVSTFEANGYRKQ